MNKCCVNCGLDISRMRRHTLESKDIFNMIQQWVAPQQVSNDNFLCHACWEIANENIIKQVQNPERKVGHTNVCVNCGCSLNHIRSHSLRPDSEREQHIRNIIIEWIQPRTVTSSSHVCHPCWQRANRTTHHVSEASSSVETSRYSAQASNEIYLPNYTRASNTERHCLFPNCNEAERLLVPTSIRVRLFCDYSFYVPPKCRICNFHLRSNTWDDLINVKNGNHNFTAEFIEDFTSMLKNQINNNIDFENIDEIDDHLVYYWLGMSKDQFRQLLESIPPLSNSHRGATGLAAYLTKLKTGDSDQRLSSLFKIPRRTLVRLMNNAKEIISQDFVPQN